MSKIKKSWEWYSHFETAHSLYNMVTGLLAVPTVVAMIAAVAGFIQGVPVMWIITACSVTFASVVGGILWVDQYKERKNPLNKISISGVHYFQALNKTEFNGTFVDDNMVVSGAAPRTGSR